MFHKVDHDTDNSQHRLLILQIWFVELTGLPYDRQMEIEERLRRRKEQYRARKDKETEEEQQSRYNYAHTIVNATGVDY